MRRGAPAITVFLAWVLTAHATDWYPDMPAQGMWGHHFVCFVLGAEVDWNGKKCPEDQDVRLDDIPDCDPDDPSELQLDDPKRFCDKALSIKDPGSDIAHDLALHCPCCADHLWKPEQLARKSQLLIPGDVQDVPVFVVRRTEDTNEILQFCKAGHVPMVTLGDGIKPTVVCDRKHLYCRCQDRSYGVEGWKETEERCHIGERCLSEDNFPEGLIQVSSDKDLSPGSRVWLAPSSEEDEHHASADQAAGRPAGLPMRMGTVMSQAGEAVTGQKSQGHVKDTFVQVLWAGDAEAKTHPCTELLLDRSTKTSEEAFSAPPETANLKGCNADGLRISTGSARCHDMDTEQCSMFYSNMDQHTGNKCRVEKESVRMCHPNFQRVKGSKDKLDTQPVHKMSNAYEYYADRDRMVEDIAHMFYTPDTGWETTVDKQQRLAFERVPSVEEVMKVLASMDGAIKKEPKVEPAVGAEDK